MIRIVLLEAAILSTLAGVLGCFLGFGTTGVALPLFAGNSSVTVVFDPLLATAAYTLALLMGLISSIYPALLAARIDPSEALRAL